MNIVVERNKVANIPVINVYDAETSKKLPVIIMLHGATGKKEDNIERAQIFAKQGFYVLLFDAYGHGELKISEEDETNNINELLKVYSETSK